MTKHFHTKMSDELHIFRVPANTDQRMEMASISNNFAGMQRAVGGYVTPYPPALLDIPDLPCGCALSVLVDEEGMMKRKPRNGRMNIVLNAAGARQPILGDAIIVARGPIKTPALDGPAGESFDFWGLPGEMRMWRGPGYPLPVGGSEGV
jgi:hypothetical protein